MGDEGTGTGGDLADLVRWEDSGGHWRVLRRAGTELVIALLTCDAREQVGLLRSRTPEVLAHVGGRGSDEDERRPPGLSSDDAPAPGQPRA